MGSHHLIIGGTGRAGTTALVQLLEACGLDAGADQLRYFAKSRAGLEGWFDPDRSPYVVKSPYFSENLERLLDEGMDPGCIDAIVVPIRDLDDAANSRIRVFADHGMRTPGGLWHNRRPSLQRQLLSESIYQLLKTASDHRIRFVPLSFPQFINDPEYAWGVLGDVLPGVDRSQFLASFDELMRPEMVSALPRPSRVALGALDLRWLAQKARLRLARLVHRAR